MCIDKKSEKYGINSIIEGDRRKMEAAAVPTVTYMINAVLIKTCILVVRKSSSR